MQYALQIKRKGCNSVPVDTVSDRCSCNPSTPDDSFEANDIEVETHQGSTNIWCIVLMYF